MASGKIIIIGIDGGTWDCFEHACQLGYMPKLNLFRTQGSWGTLRSTLPPITPAAWVAFMTGKNPGSHGVQGFQQYQPKTNTVSFTSSKSIRAETLWQKLSRHNKRAIVVGVPMTYPPLEIDGILVSGFETPSIENQFTHPNSFKDDILSHVTDFTFERLYRTKELNSPQAFAQYLHWLKRQASQNVEIMQLAMKKSSWDVAMVLIRSFDELLHHFWKLLDFNCDTTSDPRDHLMQQYFKDLDDVIAGILDIAEENNASTIIMSDHGGQTKRGNIYPNRLLRKLGYLKTQTNCRSVFTYLQRKINKRSRRHPLAKRDERNALADQLDFSNTRAYVTEVNMYASMYLQITGKQPQGSVKPDEATKLLDEITDALAHAVDSAGQGLFTLVEQPYKIYNLDKPRENLPDLMIAPREGYLMKIDAKGKKLLRINKQESLGGTHSMNGMFAAMGQQFATNKQVNAEITDITPTILAAMNLPVTDDLDGSVISEIFNSPPKIITEPPATQSAKESHDYSNDEQQQLRSRLADLGYLG